VHPDGRGRERIEVDADFSERAEVVFAPALRVGDDQAGERTAAGERRDARAGERDRSLSELGGESVDAGRDDVTEEKGEGDHADEAETDNNTGNDEEFFHGGVNWPGGAEGLMRVGSEGDEAPPLAPTVGPATYSAKSVLPLVRSDEDSRTNSRATGRLRSASFLNRMQALPTETLPSLALAASAMVRPSRQPRT